MGTRGWVASALVGLALVAMSLGWDRQAHGQQDQGGMQQRAPVEQMAVFVHGFHVGACDTAMQEPAYHYCNPVRPDFIQCFVYDGDGAGANLIGVEHIVSRDIFMGLPPEEQVLWHAHNYEVKSGMLTAPGLSDTDELALMTGLITTFGKTWHVWHPGMQEHPLGSASLMKAFTADGQIRPELIAERDAKFGVDVEQLKAKRAGIPDPGAPTITVGAPVAAFPGCDVDNLGAPFQ
ncbi:MAG: DUF1264 domain-containing protein [Myxococcota bacterium]